MRILGIDPGYERLGVAILEKNKNDKKERVIFSECFKTSSKLEFAERLKMIGAEVVRIIREFVPFVPKEEPNDQKEGQGVDGGNLVVKKSVSEKGTNHRKKDQDMSGQDLIGQIGTIVEIYFPNLYKVHLPNETLWFLGEELAAVNIFPEPVIFYPGEARVSKNN